MLKKLTPILCVENIERQLEFWVKTLGFSQIMGVAEDPSAEPGPDMPLGFVILQLDQVEIMLQSWRSIGADLGLHQHAAQSFLYIELDDLAPIEARLDGTKLAVPRRETFYGSTEIGVHDPAGNLIVFAQFQPAAGT